MAPVIMNAKDLSTPWVHVFLYGDFGSGKTTVASSWPRPIFLVPANEQSIVTLRGTDVPWTPIGSMQDMVGFLDWFETRVNKFLATVRAGADDAAAWTEHVGYDSIVWESLSHYIDIVTNELSDGGKKSMDMQRWGDVRAHFRWLQQKLRQFPVYVVYTSLADEDHGANGKKKGTPLISGATRKMLPAACEVVAYCRMREGKPPVYETHFRTVDGNIARTRFRTMPDVIKDFKFADLEPFIT